MFCTNHCEALKNPVFPRDAEITHLAKLRCRARKESEGLGYGRDCRRGRAPPPARVRKCSFPWTRSPNRLQAFCSLLLGQAFGRSALVRLRVPTPTVRPECACRLPSRALCSRLLATKPPKRVVQNARQLAQTSTVAQSHIVAMSTPSRRPFPSFLSFLLARASIFRAAAANR